jgi:hypothetical protein
MDVNKILKGSRSKGFEGCSEILNTISGNREFIT